MLRQLTGKEITALKKQGCKCEDWSSIEVDEKFSHKFVNNVRFSGKVILGRYDKEVEVHQDIPMHTGIYNCSVADCKIGNNVFLNRINILSGYTVDDDVVIYNSSAVTASPKVSYGCGIKINILNEAGGRELIMFDKLSSNLAYLITVYRHEKEFVNKINEIIIRHIEKSKIRNAFIGSGASIINSGIIENVYIGPGCSINGAASIKSGSIISSHDDPVRIGPNVNAENFVMLEGSGIDNGAVISGSFIGQGVRIGKQFSAENSAFFANCEMYHGEACSVFAGPYTVSHHKSSLLIAALYSFFNAGSGTNQSNHMYKLGPVHQGIFERGAKAGSFSYVMWPSRIGAFTTVLGKHRTNFDISEFPFSVLQEEEGKSCLIPAINLFSAGTRRDIHKWPLRDKRRSGNRLDLINYELYNPYIAGKILKAISILDNFYTNTPQNRKELIYKGVHISRLLLKVSKKYYESALNIFIGTCVMKRLRCLPEDASWEEIKYLLNADTGQGLVKWNDIGGLLAPDTEIKKLIKAVENDQLKSIEQINKAAEDIYKDYNSNEWNWCAALIEQIYNIKILEITQTIVGEILLKWKNNCHRLNSLIINDAAREFDKTARIGYGPDGDEETANKDFEAVRGTAEGNSFIREIKTESAKIEELYEKTIKSITSSAVNTGDIEPAVV